MRRHSESGMALVLVLAMLAIITAMVVEFAYGVFVNMSFLDNYKTSTRLTHVAYSGVTLASKFITDTISRLSYTYPSYAEVPEADPFTSTIIDNGVSSDAVDEVVAVRIEDETARFNVNTIVYPNGQINQPQFDAFKRLLRGVGLDEGLADRMADWIDGDGISRTEGSEVSVKNAPFDSVDELLLLPGMEGETYDKLKPYITVYGSGIININGAELPVIMSLNAAIDGDTAQRIIDRRDINPFKTKGEVNNVAGFESLLNLPITVKAGVFRVYSTARSGSGIRKIIECVLDSDGKVIYWREF